MRMATTQRASPVNWRGKRGDSGAACMMFAYYSPSGKWGLWIVPKYTGGSPSFKGPACPALIS